MRTCLVLLPLLPAGCGHRDQPQIIADAQAGAVAFQAADKPGADPAKLLAIARGLAAHVRAALANIPSQPDPAMAPAAIEADPASYAQAGEDAQRDPPLYEAPKTDGQPAPPGLREQLAETGHFLIYWCKWAAIAGAALSGLGFIYGFMAWTFLGWIGKLLVAPILAPVFRLAASLGVAGVLLGWAMVLLAAWFWWLVAVALAIGAGVAVYHHRDVAKAWDRLVAGWRRLWALVRSPVTSKA